MTRPPCSILIPCYNSERWIAQAVASALSQLPQDPQLGDETLVIDDGSSDGSTKILEAHNGRIQCQIRENRGGNPTRNQLLALAVNPWVQFLDADDYLLPAKIKTQFAEARHAGEFDVLYSTVLTDSGSGLEQPLPQNVPDPNDDLPTQWIKWQLCQTGAALWRADAIRSIGGWNESMPRCQDNELCLRAIKAGLRFKFCPTPGAVYRFWSEDTVSRKDPRALIETKTTLIDDMLDWLRSKGTINDIHRQAAGQACFEMARTLAQHDLDAAAAYHGKKSAEGLILPFGPAAPKSYRTIRNLFGFRTAERLAQFLRRPPSASHEP